MPDSVVTALAQYGLAGVFALVIGWVLYRVGLRMIAALDRLIAKIDEHTKTDVEHHAEVREELIAMRTRIDTVLDITPVEMPTRRPAGVYAFRRPATKPGDDK